MNAVESLAQVNELATNTALTVWNFASDFLIIIVLCGILFLFAWYIGRATLVSVLLAFYAAYAVYIAFPYASFLPAAPALTALLAQVGLYAALTLVFYIILRRVVVSDFLYVGIFGTIILSFLGAAFLIALAYHLFPVASVYDFTPAIDALFALKQYFFWWFVAPAIGLFFLAR
ncbi:hypothetical protein A3J11_01415 [Candidatus Kaiserbacteria bacterium RIFCSPLOWO2_02_FULL_55_12]|uniref:CvpA family protein n=1 Tax=Candidatus Kaiserbacteria bacterium RIFCSPLOWO2_02_FULL_55_12 TaxID=1798522 RepID=A0A1F6EYR2_9BACT|nr:MAG: hypothetical protein A3J11_01415 [Candidatus Kaiserbacteria bacterium RIFCSPLOWO2_02_FULL_55_12]